MKEFVCAQAVAQMEERLHQFGESHHSMEIVELESDGAARFIHRQVLELARDCLQQSQQNIISSSYFYEMSESLEKLLHDVGTLDNKY